MKRIAFKMQLYKGFEAEYKKRHDEIWAELKDLLKEHCVSDYSIFLDETTNDLFGILSLSNEAKFNDLPNHPVMKKWWAYMKGIMPTNEDNSPVSIPLKEIFYLP
ncbi:L-rhamnose mutarotase [Arachidicoccus ginsenosidimutans]|uniref:L-rhamnose mutarotase n=1 Tax=Arachidicoccus sp. BS20 TaxID=1850526 RepID=UPI0007F0950D|nr:L-rhamnose mutarotase [Arachidicoccus sp. BS20]ANI89656.1 L-rhamnose mutarotase [Arachidicoccus sp. BS20]